MTTIDHPGSRIRMSACRGDFRRLTNVSTSGIRDVEMPPELSSTVEAVLWFQLLHVFREGEARLIRQGGLIEKGDQDHLEALDLLINGGIEVLDRLQRYGVARGAKFTPGDMRAAIDGLMDTRAAVHFPSCTPEAAAVLDALFACA